MEVENIERLEDICEEIIRENEDKWNERREKEMEQTEENEGIDDQERRKLAKLYEL